MLKTKKPELSVEKPLYISFNATGAANFLWNNGYESSDISIYILCTFREHLAHVSFTCGELIADFKKFINEKKGKIMNTKDRKEQFVKKENEGGRLPWDQTLRDDLVREAAKPKGAMPTVTYSAAVKEFLLKTDVGAPIVPRDILDVIIDDIFTYRRPSAEQQECFDKITEAIKGAARTIVENTPPCKDRITALEKLREVRMWANAAVALEGLI